jgi:hypothetical protein
VYTGIYRLRHTGQGCFDLLEEPVRPRLWNAVANGYTQFGYHTVVRPVAGGAVWPAKIAVHSLTKKTGSGTVVLFNGRGQVWDRGTITLFNRVPILKP